MAIEVKALSLAGGDRVGSLIQREGARSAIIHSTAQKVVIIVADELPDTSRGLLKRHGWGYLDRRGAFWLTAPGLFVNDTALVPAGRRLQSAPGAVRGRVGLGAALWLLMNPKSEVFIRQLARALEASPSTVHEALKRLRDHALIDRSNRPLVPELFDAVAKVWRPDRISVARQPDLAEADELGMNRQDGRGWVVGGAVGAAASGVNIVMAKGAPPDFYVPSPDLVRRAVRRLGEADFQERGATIARAPTPIVTDANYYVGSPRPPWLAWPIAHPVVIALDLAQDQSRGREMLSEWTPLGFDRVW